MMGQKLRGYGHKYIRVRLNGFNLARDSTVQGLTQVKERPAKTYLLYIVRSVFICHKCN